MARTTFDRLTTADLPGPRSLSRALDPVVDGGHVMFAPIDPGAFAVVYTVGVTGWLPPPEANEDSLLVTTTNAAANKADLFLQRREHYSVRWDPATGQLQSSLRLTLENQAPAEGYPDYVLGNAVGLPRGTNRSFVSIYSPFALEAARVGGQPAALQAEVELGRNVYSTFVDIPPGGAVDIEVDLSGTIEGRRYTLDIPVQPFAKPDEATVTVEVVDGIAASREADVEGSVATWSGTLDRDPTRGRVGSPELTAPPFQLPLGPAARATPLALPLTVASPADPHGVVGEREQLLVARRVAVGPQLERDVCAVPLRRPGPQLGDLLGAAGVQVADDRPGEHAVGTGHQLDGEGGVEPEPVGEGTEVHAQRRGHDHDRVSLGPVPAHTLDHLGPQQLDESRHVRPSELVDLGRGAAPEQVPDRPDLESVAVAGP